MRADAADRMQAGAERPDEDRPEIALLRTEPVDELARDKVGERIDDREDRRDRPVVIVRPVEHRGDEVLVRQRKDLAVEVVDRRSKEKHGANQPTEVGHFWVARVLIVTHDTDLL